MVGFFSAIAFSSGNDEEKRESKSKKEVTERYDKNGDGELDYREKMTFLRELVESGEITEEQARRRMENMRRRAAESLNSEHRERHHGDREHGERHHGDREHGERHHDDREHDERHHDDREHRERHHGDREHGERHHDDREHGERHHDDREHGEKHHDDREHGERHHDDREHRERHHDDREHGEKHHENFAHEINQHFAEIEVKILFEKFSEISKHLHQLDLDRIHLEVDHETAENEPEKREISRQLKRILLLQDRLQGKRQQTRDEIFHISRGHKENEDETCNDKQKDSLVEKLEDELHHLKQEIKKLSEAGKFDQSEKVEHRAKEIFEEIERHKNHEEKRRHDEGRFKERVEQIIEERRAANTRLEELVNALEQFNDIDEESAHEEREQLEMRIHRVESHVDNLTKELEMLDK